MKKINIILIVIMTAFFTSCEEVVNVNLDTAPPRLVIEAAINWQKGTDGSEQTIKLTTTTGFYSSEIPTVAGATVYIRNSSGTIFDFIEVPGTGKYVCTDFIPVLNETYYLTVVSNGNTYTASETLNPVAPITQIVQNNEGGITGQDIEVRAYFDDPAGEINFYLYEYSSTIQARSDFYVDDDSRFNGNQFFSLSQSEDYKPGDVIRITHYGISQSYYNYMNIVVSLAGQTGGGPFQSPPATIRGNIINETDSADFPFGYFSLSEMDTKFYTIQ